MARTVNVLVVDDDKTVRLVLHDVVERLGQSYRVETAESGEQALARMAEEPFDLLITDLKLPGMSGIELTEILRRENCAVPIIWITAYADSRTMGMAVGLGVYKCLDKPLEIATIRAAALGALNHNIEIGQRKELSHGAKW